MRRTTSLVGPAVVLLVLTALGSAASAGRSCKYDPRLEDIVCIETGGGRGGTQPRPPGGDDSPPTTVAPLRYVYVGTDSVVGDCHYWSNVPGGLDSTDPSVSAQIDAIVARLPVCPTTPGIPVDPETSAWTVFRSWNLAAPAPTVTPAGHGITGIESHIAATPADDITHTETLPDGRVLDVRATPAILNIDWGDSTVASHKPSEAVGYPDGTVAHSYDLKTCTPAYRNEHPSGNLCHPTAENYVITTSYTWLGEYNVGSGWVNLGTLDITAPPITYDIDEARGVPAPK